MSYAFAYTAPARPYRRRDGGFYPRNTFSSHSSPEHSLSIKETLARTGVQARLAISQPGDKWEQEADRVAARVVEGHSARVGQVANGEPLQRMCDECEDELVSRKTAAKGKPESTPASGQGSELFAEGASVSKLASVGSTQALSAVDQQYFSRAFGENLSSVRIHTGSEASQAASGLGARAYTLGTDIVFAEGQFQPTTRAGRELLAHELTHVLQQRRSRR